MRTLQKVLLVFGDQFNDLHRKGAVLDVEPKPLNELVNVVDDRWSLNQRVHASDVDSLSVSNRRRELLHGLKQVHGQGGTVLSSGEAKHPRDVACRPVEGGEVDRCHYSLQRVYRSEMQTPEKPAIASIYSPDASPVHGRGDSYLVLKWSEIGLTNSDALSKILLFRLSKCAAPLSCLSNCPGCISILERNGLRPRGNRGCVNPCRCDVESPRRSHRMVPRPGAGQRVGIFQMATGSGKTEPPINSIRRAVKEEKVDKTVICIQNIGKPMGE